jgi:predicted transcriptional regulator
MSKPVISVRPNMDIRYTARMFENFGLSMAPVLKRGEVLGVVTYREIVLKGDNSGN